MRPRWRFACFSLLLVSSTLYAQKDTSSISGTIHDSSGAVVPNAQITIRNIATNAEQKIRSDALGEYVVAALHPAATDYLYFVARPSAPGSHHFSATFAEHEKAVTTFRSAGH